MLFFLPLKHIIYKEKFLGVYFMKNKLIRGKEFLAEKLDIPIDVMIDIPKIILLGKEELTIENHKRDNSLLVKKEIKVLSKEGYKSSRK